MVPGVTRSTGGRTANVGTPAVGSYRTVGPDGEFRPEPATVTLTAVGDGTFRGDLVLTAPGSYGVTARVIPVHQALASPYELGLAAWAS